MDRVGKESEEGDPKGPVVYVVATPIGNLADLSPRARAVLAAVDLIAAEDTRRARTLLGQLQIRPPRLVSYQDHGEAARAESLLATIIDEAASVAIISDAGTPCIADPGYRLVAAARAAGVPVHPVPGPSALTALVSASGLPSDRVLFIGFLPAKAAALRTEVMSWSRAGAASVVFFEPTRRLTKSLAVIAEIYPAARVAVGRELTKLFEETVVMAIADAVIWASAHESLRGEASVMVTPGAPARAGQVDAVGQAEHESGTVTEAAIRAFRDGATLKDLLQRFRQVGLSRSELYELLLAAKEAATVRD